VVSISTLQITYIARQRKYGNSLVNY
jgi:hypothetical protein